MSQQANEHGWFLSSEVLPKIDDMVFVSEDGINIEGDAQYLENRTCMMAGYAGGYGYFGKGFGTSGFHGEDRGLILDTPKYWKINEDEK